MTDFLYPFIDGAEHDVGALLDDLSRSAAAKAADSAHLQALALESGRDFLDAAGAAVARSLDAGGQVLAFGNGGSSTDAASVAAIFSCPPWGAPAPARNLASDPAVLTALANDVGFDLVFSRQLIAHGRPGDVAVGISTSGNSPNLIAAFQEARRRRMVTVGLAGHDGGAMATSPDLDHVFVVPSDSVHRIQEAHAGLVVALFATVQRLRNDRSTDG